MAAVAVDRTRFPHVSCVDRDPFPRTAPIDPEAPTPVPDLEGSLVQRVRELEKTYLTASIPSSAIPKGEKPVIHRAITSLQARLSTSSVHRSRLAVLAEWLHDRLLFVARAIYKLFFGVFRKVPKDVTVQAILNELKFSSAITPAQYEAVSQMAQNADKKFALILLSTFLGFPTDELSPLLTRALSISSKYAFSVLLECYLIKKFSQESGLLDIMSPKDRACLLTISAKNLESSDHIKEQLRCLRSLSYRHTLRTWIANIGPLLGARLPFREFRKCVQALNDNDPKAFARTLRPFLQKVAGSQPICNESLYAKELLAALAENPSFGALATEVRVQRFLSQCGDDVRNLTKAAKVLVRTGLVSETAKRAIEKARTLLAPKALDPSILPMCKTFRATQIGSLARARRKIETLSRAVDTKGGRHVLNLTCSCGNGHNAMVHSLSGSLRSAAAHSAYQFSTEALDVPVEVTRPVDPIYQILRKIGLSVDTTGLYNLLLRNDCCSVINLLRWLGSGAPNPVEAERKQSLIRQAILTRDPDLLNMVYAFDGNDIDKVSQDLGLPLVYVATDFDLDDWKTPPSSPFFREAVPTLHNRAIRETLRIHEDKSVEVGLCVGPEFETALSPEQLDAVRARYHISPGEKVVLFSSGGAALQNAIPERIAFGYDDRTTPIRLIVVCGRNESFKKHLEENVLPRIRPDASVSMTVLGFQERSCMAELSGLADVAIGKPGGMSSMEFLKSGTQVIFDETSFRMKWEQFNADVVVGAGHGVVMRRQEDILGLLSESLRKPKRPPASMARIKGSERYTRLVSGLVSDAEQQGWREKRRSWRLMNTTMAYSTIC